VSQIGGPMRSRPLHFIWLLDCSSSMNVDGKIQALNAAITEALPVMKEEAARNPEADLLVRALVFSTGARWVNDPTPVSSFRWNDVRAEGDTQLGSALRLVTAALQMPPMPERALPPVLVLVSDGRPTDRDYRQSLDELLALPWGQRAIRIAIAIGRDADYDVLQEFIGNDSGRSPLLANSPEDLADLIRWSSTVVVKQASQPRIRSGTSGDPLRKPPPPRSLEIWGDGITR
jgi:uncharacterized protein YegL